MSGISIGRSHSRPCAGKRTLKRCRNKEQADNVILIDVDSENCDNVIIIDIPESLPKRNQEPQVLKKDGKLSFRNVINIDDDETPDNCRPFGTSNVGCSASTSLNRESFRATKDFGDSTAASGKDSTTPVRLSKCKRTYSGKASKGNLYGLETGPECDLSSNDGTDYPDCELVEDFSGEVQELWEKAVLRRRNNNIHNVHSDIRGGSTSSSIKDHQIAESKHAARHHDEASFGQTTGKSSNGNCGPSPVRTENDDIGFTHISDDALNDQARKSKSQAKRYPSNHVKHTDDEECEVGCSSSYNKRRNSVSSNFSLNEEMNKKLNHPISTAGGMENSKEEEIDVQLQNEIRYSSFPVGATIIGEREKLKETDEYKRAMEEEWASRQQILQIQAEKAQCERRLRKRQNAESMRLLDVEKRAKQRLEEIRSIEKKDEENVNLKDKVLADVTNQLKKIEVRCNNMASLLQSLGINVGSWPNPSPQEVQSAYKRARMTFHPDRVSRSGADIRQMVEAEEKFKLINRMKEKFQLL